MVEEEEDKEEEKGRQEKGDKDKGEKERWWPFWETDGQKYKKKWVSGSHVQGATPRTVAASAEIIPPRQTCRSQEGNQPHHDSPNYTLVNALVYPRKHSRGFSRSSTHCQDRQFYSWTC